jgi:ribonuclease VapC
MRAVLDASALLAYLQDEPGCDAVEAVLAESIISSVNWAGAHPLIL